VARFIDSDLFYLKVLLLKTSSWRLVVLWLLILPLSRWSTGNVHFDLLSTKNPVLPGRLVFEIGRDIIAAPFVGPPYRAVFFMFWRFTRVCTENARSRAKMFYNFFFPAEKLACGTTTTELNTRFIGPGGLILFCFTFCFCVCLHAYNLPKMHFVGGVGGLHFSRGVVGLRLKINPWRKTNV